MDSLEARIEERNRQARDRRITEKALEITKELGNSNKTLDDLNYSSDKSNWDRQAVRKHNF